MRLTPILFLFMFITGVVQADLFSGSAESIVAVEIESSEGNKDKEIAKLKKRVEKLENELISYKKDTLANIEPEAGTVVTLPEKMFKGARLTVGGKVPKYLTAYYVSNPQTVNELKEKLKANGFNVLATTEILTDKTVITITNAELQQTNTLVSTLHVLVSEKNEISVQNPSYFGAAYLQDSYKYGQFAETLKSLQAALGDMYEVADKYELDDLAGYHFMFGMPFLDDTVTIAEGDDILVKLSDENASKHVAYTLTLPNGAMIVGHKLRNKTNTFLEIIKMEDHANILPYEVIIKDGKAVMLNPKYYLALSLPLLRMSDFRKIAATPNEIEKDIKRVYKEENLISVKFEDRDK